jgi:hypothetical protein
MSVFENMQTASVLAKVRKDSGTVSSLFRVRMKRNTETGMKHGSVLWEVIRFFPILVFVLIVAIMVSAYDASN